MNGTVTTMPGKAPCYHSAQDVLKHNIFLVIP